MCLAPSSSCPRHLAVSFSVRAVPIVTEHVTPFILSHSGVLNRSVVLCPRYAFLSFTFLIDAGHASIGVALSASTLAHRVRLHSRVLISGTSITCIKTMYCLANHYPVVLARASLSFRVPQLVENKGFR